MALDPEVSSEYEAAVKHLLRRATKRSRPSQNFSVVPHGRETDANREFARHRDVNSVFVFFVTLPMFVIAYAICVNMGAI
ncbi:hypothetical protein Q2941_49455 [Bradyrhizobium sp. UFLA05-153]